MPAMTKTSCRVLCLGLLLATWAFLVYCTSPTARANILKKPVASMPVPRKLLRSELVDLHHDETIMNDKWLTLEAIPKLIYSRFNFNAGIDFAVCELKKAANEVGPWGSKILQGNHAIVRSSGATEIFCQRCQKKSEREPVNAVFLLDGSISVPAACGINGACLHRLQPAYTIEAFAGFRNCFSRVRRGF
jgi:hypothetical protein